RVTPRAAVAVGHGEVAEVRHGRAVHAEDGEGRAAGTAAAVAAATAGATRAALAAPADLVVATAAVDLAAIAPGAAGASRSARAAGTARATVVRLDARVEELDVATVEVDAERAA